MQDSELRAWLALHRTPHLSPNALRRLMHISADPNVLIGLSDTELAACKVPIAARHALKNPPDREQIDSDCAVIAANNITLLSLAHEQYPELLKQIHDPPPLLYVRGDVSLLNRPQIAMVGSRRASKQGAENAFRFARELALKGFTITSGLAAGVDAASHQGALAAGGTTLAVLGTGVDVVYPKSNNALFFDVAHQGVLVSEFPLGTGPRKSLFPKRNRVISGLSFGVLVVEAALRSGSLISARCSMEQGREVFAIPGSIHTTASKGCHALIRQGATLVETSADIMEELEGWLLSSSTESNRDSSVLMEQQASVVLTEEEQQALMWIGFDPAPIDLLQQRSGWPLPRLASVLTTLELKGVLENVAGRYQRLA